MRHRIPSFLALLVAASALALPAMGQAVKSPSASRPLDFGIGPAGTKRPYFILHAERGSLVSGRLRVFNTTGKSLTAVLRPADATTAATGGLDFGTSTPNGDGAWLVLSKRLVRLKPFARVEIPFSARIPANAGAGDHFAGITAYNSSALALLRRQQRSPGAKPFSIKAITRLAVAIQFKVPGPSHARLQAGRPSFSAQPSGTTVTLPVRNTGNRMIPGTNGQLTLSQGTRVLSRLPVRLTTFIPETQIELSVPLTGQPVEGEYRLRGTLRPKNAPPVQIDAPVTFGSTQSKDVRTATGRAATSSGGIPGWIIGALVLALLAALFFGVALLRSRRRAAA